MNLDVDNVNEFKIHVAQRSVVYLDLNQYYAFNNLNGVMDGQWRDEYDNLLDIDPPQVAANFYRLNNTWLRGNAIDLLYQDSNVYCLYVNQVSRKVNMVIYTYEGGITLDIETELPEHTKFGDTLLSSSLEDTLITVYSTATTAEITFFDSTTLEVTFQQSLETIYEDFYTLDAEDDVDLVIGFVDKDTNL